MINPNVCQFCKKEFKYIAQHLKTKHLVYDLGAYYKKYVLQTTEDPTCKKCGKPTLLKSISRGFYKSCSPSCANAVRAKEFRAKEWQDPAKRLNRSIVSRRAARKVLKRRWSNPVTALQTLQKTFSSWGSSRSYVPRVHSVTEFGEFLLRSKNERNFISALLRLKKHILKVEYEKTYIRYFSSSQNKYRFYIPDFKIYWLSGQVDIVEIKPEKDKIDPIVIDKQNQAIIYCNENNMTYYMISPREYQKFIESRIKGQSYQIKTSKETKDE